MADRTTEDVRKRKPRRSWKDYLRLAIRQRGSTPEQIAAGVAVGMVISFSPTVGIQIPMAIIFASLFRVNRLAAIPPVFITNVFTIPPVYGFTYWLGAQFLPGKPREVTAELVGLAKRLASHDFFNMREQVREFLKLGGDLFLGMIIGGLIVGAVAAGISYYIVLRVVRRHREHRSLRLQRRAALLRTGPPET